MKFIDAREAFFDWLKPAKRSPATLRAYRSDLDQIADLMGNAKALRIADLTRDRIRKAFGSYSESRSAATIERVVGSWSRFFDFLVADGIVEGNPMAAVPRPKRQSRQPKPLAGWEDGVDYLLLKALQDGCRKGRNPWPELDVAIVATLFATGVRADELLRLNVGSVEGRPPEQFMRVRGKGAKWRSIPVGPELDIILGNYLESRRDHYPTWKPKGTDSLFIAHDPAKDGKSGGKRMTYGQLQYFIETALESSGLGNRRQPGTLAHAFRHTCGTVLASQGASVNDIKNIMGHDTLNTTQGYLDSLAAHQRDAASRNTVYAALAKLNESE